MSSTVGSTVGPGKGGGPACPGAVGGWQMAGSTQSRGVAGCNQKDVGAEAFRVLVGERLRGWATESRLEGEVSASREVASGWGESQRKGTSKEE